MKRGYVTRIQDDMPIVRNETAVTAEVGGQLVALDVQHGTCYGLNEVATRIWAMIAEPITATDICDSLCDIYDVDREECLAQTTDLLAELLAAGLARPVAGA